LRERVENEVEDDFASRSPENSMKNFLTLLALLTVTASPVFAGPSSRPLHGYASEMPGVTPDGFVGSGLDGTSGNCGGASRTGFVGRYDPWGHWGSYYGPLVH
jgi:hypothetical protein